MRTLIATLCVAAAGLLALPALARADENKDSGENPKREEMRERMLKEFDADKDGKLSDEECQKAREQMRTSHRLVSGPGAPANRPFHDPDQGTPAPSTVCWDP